MIRWMAGAASVGIAIGAAYFIHSLFKYTRMIGRIFLDLVYRPAFDAPIHARGEKITILDSADQEIAGLFLENKAADKVVIFCPASGTGVETWEKYGWFLPGCGYSVVSVDIKAAGAMDHAFALAQWPCQKDAERLVTVVRWVKNAVPNCKSAVLFGVSNGADIALAAAAMEPSIGAVVTDGLFSMKEIFRDYIRRWAPILVKPAWIGERLPRWIVELYAQLGFWYTQKKSQAQFIDVEALLARYSKPLLMIHGEKDDYVSSGHRQRLEKAAKPLKGFSRYRVAEAGHNEAVTVAGAEYERTVTEFLHQMNAWVTREQV